MSAKAPQDERTDRGLTYVRYPSLQDHNESEQAAPAIIFLHGSESCHLEFTRIAPLLRDAYEIFLVDLPAHSGSKDIVFSFDNAVTELAHLVNTKVTGSQAHVVGLSLGGFVGLEFARQRPEMVLSLWCTGCAPSSGLRRWVMSRSLLLSAMVTLIGRIVNETMFWASFGEDVTPIPGLREAVQANQNISTLKPVFEELGLVTLDRLAQIKGTRIAIIAGGKQDSVESTLEVGKVLRRQNPACSAFVVREAIHWWSLQMPEVFAQGVRAWVEGSEMPKAYIKLGNNSTADGRRH
jgi:pimeloyl-ACP methyl ester carboxylesterase